MNITGLAIDKNRVTWIFLLILVFAGIQAFIEMPRAYDPGFIIRTAQVLTYFPGASPERVEKLVTAQIEEVVKQIPELDFVKSESRTGVSVVSVNIKESYKVMRPIWDNLRRKVEDAASNMPDGVVGPYVNDDFGDVYGIVFTIKGEGFNYAELFKVADEVEDRLMQITDVAKVEIYGAQDERIFVEYDNAQLVKLGISPYQLSQALESRNIVISGGAFNLGNERIELEPTGNYESVDDIARTIIQIPGTDRLVYLKDIAKVKRGYVDPASSIVHSSGTHALAIAIAMREGGNNITLGEQINLALTEFLQSYPHGIEFDVVNFSPAEVDKKVSDFVSNLLQAILVVTLVMLLSLGFRTGLVVASLIPTAMLFAFIIMSGFNIGLDQISLAALIIALGMLVDNGIVMSESIMVQMQSGKSPIQSAIDSALELRIPLLTASLTTAAAFLPIYLAESSVGEFTASLFTVVSITLLCSWLISITIIPLFCVIFLRVKQSGVQSESKCAGHYKKILLLLLNNQKLTLTGTTAIFVIAMLGFGVIPKLFFPPSDRAYFKAELEMPVGTNIGTMQTIVSDMEHFIRSELVTSKSHEQGVTNWVSYIGSAGPRFVLAHNPKSSVSNYALMLINVTDYQIINKLMDKLRNYAFANHPDLEITLKRIENGPSITNPVEFRLSGKDTNELFIYVDKLKTKMTEVGGLINIIDDWGQRIKKIVVKIDQARALRIGVTSQDIALSLQSGLSGIELTEYREGDDVIPVILRSSVATQNDISKVESLSVYVQSTGKSVPLLSVASVDTVWQAAKIFRRDGLKTVTVGAQITADTTAVEKFAELIPWLEEQKSNWPAGYRYELGGEAESSGKANQSIMDKLPIAGFIILILLVAQFNSIRKSLIILITIPLGLIGVVIGLLVAKSFFGFMTLLGIISLAGIVINNAIVLLERINIELDNGLHATDAIITAAQQRMRPILLTTATTVLGLIPLYLGGGEMWEPMAVAIMSGLLFSTVLTLGVVPVLYATLFKVKYAK